MTDQASNSSRTELENLGEFGLIDHLTKEIKLQNSSSKLGVGDDAALILNEGMSSLISTDLLLEGVHFDLSYVPLQHLGYKAVTVNISDIVAMNGRCEQITIGLALSNRFSLEALETLYEGIQAACKYYGVDLVGGDTSSSNSGLVIAVTAVGKVDPENVVTRSGAQPNDLVCITGNIGAAYLGLQVLAREKQVYLDNAEMQPQLEGYEYLIQRQLTAEARVDVIQWFAENNIKPTAMIDLSDGMASDLLHICKNSQVGARIYQDKLPLEAITIDTALEFKMDPTTCALNGGEDYELLFTINQEHFKLVDNHSDISIVGHVMEKDQGVDLVLRNEEVVSLKAQGWKHF